MKKIIPTLILLFVALGIFAQTKVYKGNSTSYFDCISTFDHLKVYRGNSTSYFDCIYTLDGQIPEFLLAILAGPF